jgi:hypothetical protein
MIRDICFTDEEIQVLEFFINSGIAPNNQTWPEYFAENNLSMDDLATARDKILDVIIKEDYIWRE